MNETTGVGPKAKALGLLLVSLQLSTVNVFLPGDKLTGLMKQTDRRLQGRFHNQLDTVNERGPEPWAQSYGTRSVPTI